MVDIQTISIILASASVIAGVVYYAFQIRHQTRIRQTDLVTRIYSTFNTGEFTKAGMMVGFLDYKDYDDFVKKYGQPSPEKPIWVAVYLVCNFFNEVGILLHGKHVSIEQVDELLGYRIVYVWERLRPWIEGLRSQVNPRAAEWFEYLYNEMKKYERKPQQKGVVDG